MAIHAREIDVILQNVARFHDERVWVFTRFGTVSYTHLTLPTNREV